MRQRPGPAEQPRDGGPRDSGRRDSGPRDSYGLEATPLGAGPRDSYGLEAMPLGGGPRDSRSRRIISALVVVVGLAIVGIGLLGPKDDGQLAGVATATSRVSQPIGSTGSSLPPHASPSPSPSPVTRRPPLVVSGAPLADPFVLLGGRWVDLRTSTAQEPGCGSGLLLVLAGGRIICVFERASRPPGAKEVTLTLRASTFGRVRTEPGAKPPSADPVGQAASRAATLTSLTGRADATTGGQPVATSVAAGSQRDTFVVAWAVLGSDGYRLGLDLYRFSGTGAVRDLRVNLARIALAAVGDVGLADLAVSVAPDGRHALVGISGWAPPPGWGSEIRRLWVVPLEHGASRGPVPGAADALPVSVAPGDVPCGGSSREGFATNAALYLVCNDAGTYVLRRYRIGAPGGASLLGESRVAAGAEPGWRLVGTTVVDRAHGLWYRWMPIVHRLVRFDLAGNGGPVSVVLSADVTPAAPDPLNLPGPPRVGGLATHPLLALSPDGRRAYLVGLPTDAVVDLGGRGPGVDVVDTSTMTPLSRWSVDSPQPTGIVVSRDGRLAYLSSDPTDEPPGQRTIALVVRDASDGAYRLAAGRLPASVDDPLLPLTVR